MRQWMPFVYDTLECMRVILCLKVPYITLSSNVSEQTFHYNSIFLTDIEFNRTVRSLFVCFTGSSYISMLFEIVHKNLYYGLHNDSNLSPFLVMDTSGKQLPTMIYHAQMISDSFDQGKESFLGHCHTLSHFKQKAMEEKWARHVEDVIVGSTHLFFSLLNKPFEHLKLCRSFDKNHYPKFEKNRKHRSFISVEDCDVLVMWVFIFVNFDENFTYMVQNILIKQLLV